MNEGYLFSGIIFLGIFVPLALVIAGNMYWFYNCLTNPQYENVKMVSLERDKLMEGHFFLGSGRIEEVPQYFFYKINSDGSYSLEHKASDNIRLFEDDSTPRYLPCTHTMHVPVGTIVKEYKA